MRYHQAEIRPDPTISVMDLLLDDIERGLVRVPEFQRPFVWRPNQMVQLFDSIERGFPIGSLLLWYPEEKVPSLNTIGGIRIPPPQPGRSVGYVLDGHQRLTTLFGVLRGHGRHATTEEERDWRWRICRDLRDDPLESDRYRHFRGQGEEPEYLLPLSAVTRTRDFLRFSRRLESAVKSPSQVDEMVREAELVAQQIKSYKLTLIRLQGASLDQAVEVYTRLNRTGMQMDPDQMVSALTYRESRPPLATRIDQIVDSVNVTGFGAVPRTAVFRALLAIGGEPDILSPRWETVARHMQNRLHDAIPATQEAVGRAVRFLQEDVRMPLARLLPYSHQLVLLAVFFKHQPEPSQAQRDELRRWFWATSWAGEFAGATSTKLRRAIVAIDDFATGQASLKISPSDMQPMPDTFNLNSARTRAYVIWELGEFPRRLDMLGQPFDVVKELASADSQSYRQVVQGDKRPANRLIMPTRPNISLLQALKDLEETASFQAGRAVERRSSYGALLEDAARVVSGGREGSLGDGPSQATDRTEVLWEVQELDLFSDPPAWRRVLRSHGIPVKAWRRLNEGGNGRRTFVDDRTDYLAKRLRGFAESLGVPLGERIEGTAEDDSE